MSEGRNTELVPRATIHDVVRFRNQTIALYEDAFEKIEAAHDALQAAREMGARCHPGVTSYNYDKAEELKEFEKAVQLPRRDRYLRTARRLTDINAWSWIIQRTDLERRPVNDRTSLTPPPAAQGTVA